MQIILPAHDHCVYILTKRDHVVIYVGVTSNLFGRLGMHFLKSWWGEVASVQVESFQTRAEAEAREAHLIQMISPLYNVLGSDLNEARHLEEMRLATQALRAQRGISEAVMVPELDVSAVCTPTDGITLTQAAPLLAPVKLATLRVYASRDKTFPMPLPLPSGQKYGPTQARLYSLDELRKWRASKS